MGRGWQVQGDMKTNVAVAEGDVQTLTFLPMVSPNLLAIQSLCGNPTKIDWGLGGHTAKLRRSWGTTQ